MIATRLIIIVTAAVLSGVWGAYTAHKCWRPSIWISGMAAIYIMQVAALLAAA